MLAHVSLQGHTRLSPPLCVKRHAGGSVLHAARSQASLLRGVKATLEEQAQGVNSDTLQLNALKTQVGAGAVVGPREHAQGMYSGTQQLKALKTQVGAGAVVGPREQAQGVYSDTQQLNALKTQVGAGAVVGPREHAQGVYLDTRQLNRLCNSCIRGNLLDMQPARGQLHMSEMLMLLDGG